MNEVINSSYPPVSVALCTYNGEAFIASQLDSILEQTYTDIAEIVCVDDRSTDGTLRILEQYAIKDSRIKVIQNADNLGYIKNFEKAVLAVSSEFIALSDQDDIWYPDKISRLMSAIGDKMLVYSDSEYIDVNGMKLGKRLSDYRHLGECNSCLNFALFNGISGHTVMIKKQLLDYAVPFFDKLPYDQCLGFHAARFASVAFVPEALVGYRQHANNLLGAIGVGEKKAQIGLKELLHHQLITYSECLSPTDSDRLVFSVLTGLYGNWNPSIRFKRIAFFMRYRNELLFFKKRSRFRKMMYCFKMFSKII
jgi:glycosyltransferase involved in cell wall biosynthesis